MAHISSAMAWRGAEAQVHGLFHADTATVKNFLFCPEGSVLLNKNRDKEDVCGSYKKIFGWDILGGIRLKKFLRRHLINIVHIHDSHALNLYWMARMLGSNIPAVYHKHHNHPVKNKWKYDRASIRRVICVSQAVYETASKQIDPEKLVILHPALFPPDLTGVSLSLRTEFHIPATASLVGMVCALEKEKNVLELIDVAKYCQKVGSDVYLIVIGTGKIEEQIRGEIVRADMESRIHLAGFRENIPGLLQQLDIFLFTSLSEGFPLAVLEAMQAGVPVVCRGSGGLKEMVRSGETGLIYHHPAEAAENIKLLLTETSLREKISGNARLFARGFSAEIMIQKTHTLYQEILA